MLQAHDYQWLFPLWPWTAGESASHLANNAMLAGLSARRDDYHHPAAPAAVPGLGAGRAHLRLLLLRTAGTVHLPWRHPIRPGACWPPLICLAIHGSGVSLFDHLKSSFVSISLEWGLASLCSSCSTLTRKDIESKHGNPRRKIQSLKLLLLFKWLVHRLQQLKIITVVSATMLTPTVISRITLQINLIIDKPLQNSTAVVIL